MNFGKRSLTVGFDSNGYRTLRSKDYGCFFARQEVDSLVLTERCTKSDEQQWKFQRLPGGYVKLLNKQSGACLSVEDVSDGAELRTAPCIENDKKQKWTYLESENWYDDIQTVSLKPKQNQRFCLTIQKYENRTSIANMELCSRSK